MGFHSLVLHRKLCVQHRREGCVHVDGKRRCALLLQPGAEDLRVGLHTGLLLGDDKDLVREEVEAVLGGLTLGVAEVHDPTHVHVPQVVPASTGQNLQGRDGEAGPTLAQPVGGPTQGVEVAGVEE